MRRVLLALDAGSSQIKTVLFDEAGLTLAEASAPAALLQGEPGAVERDLPGVWKAVRRSLAELRGKAPVPFARIEVVGVTGAGDGLILLDREGEPVRPAITSLDTRASDAVVRFKRSRRAGPLYSLIGELPYPATALPLLQWMRRREPSSYRRGRTILFLKDWVRFMLTGELCTDPTDASATLTDVHGAFRPEIFRAFGVGDCMDKVPEIRPSHERAGSVTRRAAALTGLAAGLPVVCGLHDCSASSLGTGCWRAGETCMIMGSWCGNQVVSEEPVLNRRHPDHQILRSYAIPGTWLVISASPTSLVNLSWFVDAVVRPGPGPGTDEPSLYSRIETLVSRTTSADGLVYHPYLYGSLTSEKAGGGFYGIRPWHTRAHLARALLEGIAINYSIHQGYLEESHRVSRLSACGGGTRSATLMQAVADAVNRTVRICASSQPTALGAAITAAVGAGLYRDYPAACRAMTSVQAVIGPRSASAAAMRAKRAEFLELYERMLPYWHGYRT